LFFLFFFASANGALSCLDASNIATDYFAALKQPNGYEYQVFSGNSFSDGGSLETGEGPIGKTLKSFYSCKSCAYALYNDQTPDGKDHDSNAHMKGVIAFDGTSGFWLVHSVPRFLPVKGDGYKFPVEQTKYGQSFLCITLSATSFNTIGKVFQTDYPHIYESNIPSSLEGLVPDLVDYINNSKHNKTASAVVFNIKSLGGTSFDVFAKNKQWNQELYEYLVSPYYNSGMLVESWRNGVGNIGSYCRPEYPYSVVNVLTLSLPNGFTWKVTQDHAKWGVTSSGNYTCIGDINRQEGQFHRGGGTVCFHHMRCWGSFYNLIDTMASC